MASLHCGISISLINCDLENSIYLFQMHNDGLEYVYTRLKKENETWHECLYESSLIIFNSILILQLLNCLYYNFHVC